MGDFSNAHFPGGLNRVTVNGEIQTISLKDLVAPFLVTKVNLQTSVSLPDPNDAPRYFTYPVIYDCVEIDNFNMYNKNTGVFTIPTAGWWKITYTNTQLNNYNGGMGSNLGEMTINGYVEKNGTEKHLPAVAELAVINNLNSTTQEIRTAGKSDIVHFEKDDTFSVKGMVIAGYDFVTRTNHIFLLGNPDKYDVVWPGITDDPQVAFTSGFNTLTTCTVELERSDTFPFPVS